MDVVERYSDDFEDYEDDSFESEGEAASALYEEEDTFEPYADDTFEDYREEQSSFRALDSLPPWEDPSAFESSAGGEFPQDPRYEEPRRGCRLLLARLRSLDQPVAAPPPPPPPAAALGVRRALRLLRRKEMRQREEAERAARGGSSPSPSSRSSRSSFSDEEEEEGPHVPPLLLERLRAWNQATQHREEMTNMFALRKAKMVRGRAAAAAIREAETPGTAANLRHDGLWQCADLARMLHAAQRDVDTPLAYPWERPGSGQAGAAPRGEGDSEGDSHVRHNRAMVDGYRALVESHDLRWRVDEALGGGGRAGAEAGARAPPAGMGDAHLAASTMVEDWVAHFRGGFPGARGLGLGDSGAGEGEGEGEGGARWGGLLDGSAALRARASAILAGEGGGGEGGGGDSFASKASTVVFSGEVGVDSIDLEDAEGLLVATRRLGLAAATLLGG